LLVQALVATTTVAASLHTHAYGDHDHPEHRHGISAHEHHGAANPADGTAHLEGCDPGSHTVSLTFTCTALLHEHAIDAEDVLPASATPQTQIEPAVGYADVRVHGPPPLTGASPRAPPLIVHL
jgi:hypothetical protein